MIANGINHQINTHIWNDGKTLQKPKALALRTPQRRTNWLKVSGMPIAPFRTSLSCYLFISISISISTIRYTCNLATVEDIVPPSTFSHSDSFGLSANTAQRTASPRGPNGPIREFYRTCWDAYLPHTQTLCPTLGTGGKIKGWTQDQPLCGIQINTNTHLPIK